MTAAVAQTDLDRIAPYPLTEDMVTAANMSRWLAVQSYRSLRIDVEDAFDTWESAGCPGEGSPERDAYDAALSAATAEGVLALVLRDLPRVMPVSQVNELAVRVWRLVDGDSADLQDDLESLLEGIGIDPEAVAT